MLANGAARLNIVFAQTNAFDYEEFKKLCEEGGHPVFPMTEWTQKVGIAVASSVRFPELPHAEAYTKFVYEMNRGQAEHTQAQRVQRETIMRENQAARPLQIVEGQLPPAPCCGGGMAL